MRIEGQDQGRNALLLRLSQCPTEYSLVTAVNTIKIADRNDAAPQIFGQRPVSGQSHAHVEDAVSAKPGHHRHRAVAVFGKKRGKQFRVWR
jgi:hypothetical protein